MGDAQLASDKRREALHQPFGGPSIAVRRWHRPRSMTLREETLLLKKLHDDVGCFNTIIVVSSMVLLSFDKFSLTF